MGIACDSVGGGGGGATPLAVAASACPACVCAGCAAGGGGGGNVIDSVTVCGAATVEACVDVGGAVATPVAVI